MMLVFQIRLGKAGRSSIISCLQLQAGRVWAEAHALDLAALIVTLVDET